jgi:hypothetical protein
MKASREPRWPAEMPCSGSKSIKSLEDQPSAPWVNTAMLLGRQLVSEFAVIEVHPTQGGGDASKEGEWQGN